MDCMENYYERGDLAMIEWLSSDGKIITTMTKIGHIIMLNVLCILCCIPIITIGSSITSFYYAMVKTVRKERSYPSKEFFRSFKRTLLPGGFITILLIMIGALFYMNREYVTKGGNTYSLTIIIIYDALILLLIGFITYVFPVLSRFQLKLSSIFKMTLLMEFRHLPYTTFLITGTIFCGFLLLVLPLPFWLILPGGWCYLSTFLLERILKIYTPKPQEGEDAWYYEL
ncbi:MAG TPA: hypothetical protein DHW61_04415 [Lachnoclostridium phytofermentans]|uniref:DUF624 domain-containing protein n=2 Tax=Lachnoclostridium TaxID=1506553 RepID=A0A3D2X3C7_9FIRM|nr:hypothetical protein [Lachnoclostridium phytofermentans]